MVECREAIWNHLEIVRTIDVIAAIDEIGDDITLDSYDAINRARTLYERLDTDAKKARVSNYDKLLEAGRI